MALTIPQGGVGIGLRAPHFQDLLRDPINTDFLEIHSENYFNPHSEASAVLDRLAQQYAISCHGIGLSLGSVDPINPLHLKQLSNLIERVKPRLISEHLSWSSVGGEYFNDLLPMPYTEQALQLFGNKVDQVQQTLGRQILVENPSVYLTFKQPEMTEWQFLNRLVEQTQCGLLLDLNNIYVSSFNQGCDSHTYLAGINPQAVQEIHLAGFTVKSFDQGELLIDTHGSRVSEPVWQLYRQFIAQWPNVATLIEWDTDIPSLDVLLQEQGKAEQIRSQEVAA
ncbi:MNIO family bufferin maturase [Motilimonas pumila]|uniref:DUF692 domain-containing protein n=1 Tax=Motilimonas pumila TaxID=2303987 RepID=A0A418YA75_9GAMM|nr:DUF692 domain-containing protein [Motilimonas pumila]RJG39189.1 DUF692 domain-containing protein [Motilimonas pumila]